MSTNNQLVIIEKENKFFIHENSCVDNDFKSTKDNLLKIENTLRDAIKWAEEYCNTYPYVEYGYTIHLEGEGK